MNMFTTEVKFNDPKAKQDFLHLVAIIKITLHRTYQKDETILYYTEEKKAITWYKTTLDAVKITNKKMNKFHTICK